MSTYTAPQRTNRKRSLSRRVRIVLLASLLVPASLLAIANVPASAAAKYATIQDVQDAISTALSPIQSTIASLQSTQATHTSQINDLQTQQTSQANKINDLQNSTGKNLKAYDANNQELGLVTGHGASETTVFVPSLNKFIEIADSTYAEQPFSNTIILSSGIAASLDRIYYLTSDCTGTLYGATYNSNSNTIMAFDTTHNYTYHSSDPPITSAAFSWRNWTTPTTCQNGFTTSLNLWPLYPVNLPFPTPIAEPLQFKYQ